jgi:hypothetical protein
MTAETVKLTLELPKGVVDFASDLLKFGGSEQSVEEFLAEELTGDVRSILEDLPTGWFDREKLLQRYGLNKE